MNSQEPDKRSPMKHRARRLGPVVAAAAVLAAVLAVGLFAVIADRPCPLAAGRGANSSLTPLSASTLAPRTDAPEDASMAADPQARGKAARQAVEKLISEEKFEAAAEETARIREEAKKAGDNPLWAWALIKEGQLRTALHGYETAVRFFKEQAWPDSPLERDMLDLFFANSLVVYYHAYSWDIDRRERIEARGPIDLKSWTRDQIFDEAWRAALRVWKDRERLAERKPGEFPDFWTAGDYPAGVRDTLRDGVVYLMARLLADTGFWTPRQSNETWLLDLDKLLTQAGKAGSVDATELILESTSSHPVEKICALLGEHESFSRRASRPEAALEARFELVQALHEAFNGEDSRSLIRRHLADFLSANRKHAWWAVGQALLAEYTREEAAPDALVRARKLAAEGVERFPASPGGKHCLHILKSIEAPEYSVEAMRVDAAGRRSVRITHRNLDRVFLRAYALDLEALIKTARDNYIFPQGDESRKIVEGRRPEAAWKADLAKSLDYRDHRTYANLPEGLAPGLYLVAASAREDFAGTVNRTVGLSVIVGDLVMVKRAGGGTARVGMADLAGGEEVLILSGGTGRPVSGATVDLYAFNWRKGHTKVESKTTDAQGRVWFAPREREVSIFLFAKKGRDIVFDSDYFYLQGNPETKDSRAALIYTDRSIYRPGQKIFWKILAYKGRADLGRLSPDTGTSASVWLEDINGQRVAQATVATNAFGTASGEFAVPATGRPLGGWRLRSSPEGYAGVRVEEYKRPTFEVSVKDPEKPLRLNRSAALKGEARYYFGLPVAAGEAVWQVKREPVYPRWWWWETGGGRSQPVAGGRAKIGATGVFDVEFTPSADEKKDGAASGLSYRYTLSVDVTDEGGETRSASRSFRLGFISVEARLEAASEFVRADAKGVFTVTRADLNGTPKAGKGAWRVVRLVQPEVTLLPADQPLLLPPGTEAPMFPPTPGDLLRPRWESCSPDTILRLWKEGSEAAKGAADHDAKGMATVGVPALGPGAYRLLYETKDDFGAVCRDSLDFLVVGEVEPALRLPLVLRAERPSVPVGGTARLFVDCGWIGQPVLLETFRGGELWERRWIEAGKDGGIIDMPVTEELRGGFGARVTAVRDHQYMSEEASVFVPWDNKELGISFSTFRDKLTPGGRETWRVTVKTPGGKPAVQGAAELLAYMYDRSLDLFAPHRPPRLAGLYPNRTGTAWWDPTLGTGPMLFAFDYDWNRIPSYPSFRPDELFALGGYGIGGPGGRMRGGVMGGVVGGVLGGVVAEEGRPAPQMASSAAKSERALDEAGESKKDKEGAPPTQGAVIVGQEVQPQLRSNFAETAFWQPHLLTGADGTATIEFTVPDSVTGWRVFVHGVTRDLMGGTLEAEARSVKDLMVRPYLPRFFREGDKAELRVMVNNAGAATLAGEVALEIYDPLTNENLAPAFGLPASVPARAFSVAAGGGAAVVFPLLAPARVGTVAFKVVAKSGALSDGELRPLPVLPGRMHLVQSRFATIKEGKPRELRFDDLAKTDDPTRINEQLVVTVDAQLFYGLLEALPYLVNYPYECTEQTLNRFLSTGILTSLYDKYPSVARMAQELSKRETIYETFDAADPNRKMALEETPWLETAQGGKDAAMGLGAEKVLDPRVAKVQRESSLAKLLKAQTSLGAFPWWPGGPPSPYMTLYIVQGFSKALEFGVDVPKEAVARAFAYLHRHYLDEIVSTLMAHDTGWEFVTFLNYTIGNFPDASWTGGVFTDADRKRMLDFSFKHWKEHAPYLKGYLSLTLNRAGRPKDAALVWASVMDSAKTTIDGGTSWAPEDRGWLWYNDTVETHAFALRTLMELKPADTRSEGLVQWLFLNKKLNHWKSTRATSEVIYSVAYFLKKTGALGVRELVTAEACGTKTTFTFEPDKYTGKKNQLVVPGEKMGMGPECATVRVSKEGKGMAFASATWHFSTEKMPEMGDGDLFAVERTYFKREKKGEEVVLKPLADGAPLAVGDEIEVQLAIRARHQAEYVHLRDPRPSGCEPVTLTSGYKWDLGLVRYEEIRDSGTNFFVEWLPEGEYTLKHRMRCAMAGTFKAAPATLQSMYAPEFAAYSAGALVTIK